MTDCLPPEIADALLARLERDDDFRATFKRSPREALAQLGYGPALESARTESLDVEQGSSFACLHGEGLPSKEEIARTRDSLRAQITDTGNHSVFRLSLK